MNKNKNDVIIELKKLKDKNIEFYQHIKCENQTSNMHQIINNCIMTDCPKHNYVEYDGINWHICFDDWSIFKNGWHPIYCETLDLCTEKQQEDNK